MLVKEVDYPQHQTQIHRIRDRVFIDEQSVPPELERDDRDPLCRHVLAIDAGHGVGTGRIDLQNGGKIGRVAVLSQVRGQGLGRLLMEALHQIAEQAGVERVRLHAQQSAIPFYITLGYEAVGEPFVEADIPHQSMVKQITTHR